MTPAERVFWQRVMRRANRLSPELARAALRGFAALRDGLSASELARLIRGASIERVLDATFDERTLDQAFRHLRASLQHGVTEAGKAFAIELPGEARGIAFDVLNPRIVDGIRQLQTRAVTTLQEGMREVARAHIENGLRDGAHPTAIARQLRDVLSLAPNQHAAVVNFERLLRAGDAEALTRQLRDRRFDAMIRKGNLTSEQIDRMVDAYRRRMTAFNAETNARTMALDAQKLGQRLTWEDAIERGDVDGSRLMKRWAGVLDDRERPSHVAMEGQVVKWDEPFSNGQQTPGDDEYNCRCVAVYFVARAALPIPELRRAS